MLHYEKEESSFFNSYIQEVPNLNVRTLRACRKNRKRQTIVFIFWRSLETLPFPYMKNMSAYSTLEYVRNR